MPRFQYKARDNSGNMVNGTMEAASADTVASQLMGQQVTPIDIRELSASRGRSDEPELSTVERINAFLAGNRIDIQDLIIFSRQMYSLTRAGLPLDRALTGLLSSMKHMRLRRVLKDVVASLEGGQTLSTAMGRHPEVFSPLFLALINVGENTGQLDLAFEQINRYLELERETRKQVKSATRYPLFVVATIAVALAVITYFVIPAFAETFERLGAELPLETRILIGISDFVVNWWYLLLGGAAALFFGFRSWVRSPAGKLSWDHRKLGFPLVGPVFERIALARFARTFSMIMKSGVPLVHGLSVVAGAVGNEHISSRVLKMRDGIARGDSLYHTAWSSHMFSPLVLQMIAVGEESGNIDELMAEVADFYDAEVQYDIKRLSEAIEPILIMFIGAMVLVLALGVFLPIWDLSSAVNN